MKVIIVGYGRVGTQVVKLLGSGDHEIVVIDKTRSALDKAAGEARVKVLNGDAVDPDMLRQAGADQADVVMALTREENTNLMAAQIAKVAFRVPKVIAMVYDPSREQSFHAAGVDILPIAVSGAAQLISQVQLSSPLEFPSEPPRNAAAEPAPLRAVRSGGPYHVVIMGGGKVGYYLGRTMLEEGHDVTLIESNSEIFELVSRQLDSPVVHGDGSSYAVLEKAGAGRADVFVGVTNRDQDNLIGCQVAKREFGVPKTVARVKNPKNEWIMQQLGVDVTVSSTAIISSLIESELPVHKIRTLLSLRAGQLEIMEYVLDGDSPVIGHPLKELTMPLNCNIVTVLRNGTAVIPRGDTAFEREDVVLALADLADEAQLRKLLLG